ncbi:hypothetical protein [Deinococcus sonorensis]|uniref:Uncharacterized protein n=2 Tax=Deinococcus sonorensis TaxID=309891 RepID=A0AAU7UCM4_9DEIO
MSVKVFGKLEVLVGGEPVKLSARAVTLLTYLALEGGRIHRTTAAQLLWSEAGPQGLRNLRVELTALRRLGIELSPNRSSSLSLHALTELDDLQQRSGQARARLAATLTQPLLNFNDHGNPALGAWARRQRHHLTRAVEQLVSAATSGAAQPSAPLGVPADRHLVQWIADRILPELQSFVQGARHPQLALYVGRSGSGRRESLDLALTRLGLTQVEVTASASLDSMQLLLRANLMKALHQTEPQDVPQRVHRHGAEPSELSELTQLLMKAGPLAIVVHAGERLSLETTQLIDLMLGLARPLLVVVVATSAGRSQLEDLLSHHDQPGWFQVIAVPTLTPESLPARFGEDAASGSLDSDDRFEIIRQSEGFLAAIRCQLPSSASVRGRLGQRLHRTLHAELAVVLGADLEYLQVLALLPGPFSEVTALGTLSQAGLEIGRARWLLRHALQACILEHVDSVIAVRMPQRQVRLPDDARLLWFHSELQRAALAGSLDAGERHRLKPSVCTLPTVVEPSGPGITLTPSTTAPALVERHDSTLLPGGYVLLTRAGGWTVQRLGAAGHAVPRLELHFAAPAAARRWQFLVQLQRRTGAEPGVQVLNGAGQLFQQVRAEPWLQPLEPGGWMQAEGALRDQRLILAVQATDLILHLERPTFI